jgi:putative transposase
VCSGASRSVLRIDNGPEFRSKNLDLWAKEHAVALFFIEPGQPTQNGQIESFNGRFRAECLDQEWFTSLSHARRIIADWRKKYNTLRPHSSLGYLPPNTWAQNSTSAQISSTADWTTHGGDPHGGIKTDFALYQR